MMGPPVAYHETRPAPVAVEPATASAPPAEPTATRPAGATAMIRVTTEPPGATVTIDGVRQPRTTNTDYPVTRGSHRLVIEKSGFYPQDMTVNDLKSYETRRAGLSLKALAAAEAPTLGKLLVTSKGPVGAQVWVDGVNTGLVTPCTVERLTAGPHTVNLVLDGFEAAAQGATVSPGGVTEVTIVLRRVGR